MSVINVVTGLLFFGLLVQAQNLMADLSSARSSANYVFWAGVFGFTFLLWAFPVHYGARRCLDAIAPDGTLDGHLAWLIRWLPRGLGLAPFVALALGIHGAIEAVKGARYVLATADLTIAQGIWLYAADAVAFVTFAIGICLRRRLIPDRWTGAVLHPVAAVVTALIFAFAYIAPIDASVYFPRALLVPPLFGSLVLGASALTRLGDRTGFPFLTTLALLLGVATGLNADFNLLRTLPTRQVDQRLKIDAAITAWKAANNCTIRCPRPLVIAIDGGASRAAFTAATFVGELLDRMPKPTDDEAQSPGRRIFAISGVSGGSYGAAVIQAALADAQRAGHGMSPPCRSAQTTWFGYDAWAAGDKSFSWRQCLQALTSGDYLSSTIIGLAFRDFAAPPWQAVGLPAMPDRAAILEMTWERQYAATLQPGYRFYEGGASCEEATDVGLCRRMAHPAAFLGGRSRTPLWMPMLLLNSTSVATGRRVISADLASTKASDGNGGSLYSQAFDLREAMSDQCPSKPPPVAPTTAVGTLAKASAAGQDARSLTEGVCAQADAPIEGPDVRLSTAALTSARFPIISPAGIFSMEHTLYGDQVVDGGYFENSGLTTALDIVEALRLQKVDATLISISNNPAFDPPTDAQRQACEDRYKALNGTTAGFSPAVCTGLPRRPALTPMVGPGDNTFFGRFFGLFYRPLQTLVATGDGHADEVMGKIAANPPKGGFYHLQVEVAPIFDGDPPPVGPDADCRAVAGKTMTMTKVSMSWWLAAAVQADLDIQRCSKTNRAELAKLDGAFLERIALP